MLFYSFFFIVSLIQTSIESGAISPPPPPPIKGVPLNNNKNEQQDLGEFRILSFRLQEGPSDSFERFSDLLWRIDSISRQSTFNRHAMTHRSPFASGSSSLAMNEK